LKEENTSTPLGSGKEKAKISFIEEIAMTKINILELTKQLEDQTNSLKEKESQLSKMETAKPQLLALLQQLGLSTEIFFDFVASKE